MTPAELETATNEETDPVKRALFELMQAAAPFTAEAETSGTIPLVERLERAIEEAQKVL
jgi:hypothetical protein